MRAAEGELGWTGSLDLRARTGRSSEPPGAAAMVEVAPDHLGSLVERARDGDLEAFESLLSATERRVLSLAYRLLGSRDQARDAAQEVYLRVYRSLKGFRRGEDFNGWLYRITVNVCRDLWSRPGRAASLEAETEAGRLAEPSQPSRTEDELLRAERWRLVRRALETLPSSERAALVLRDIEGLTSDEVARHLGNRPGTVRAQVASARQKVRRYCARILGTEVPR